MHIQTIRGQAPDSEGGSDLDKIFRGEGFFWLFVLGMDFLTSMGGISFRLLYKNFKNFPKFSGQGGGLFGFLAQIFLKGGEYFAKESPS